MEANTETDTVSSIFINAGVSKAPAAFSEVIFCESAVGPFEGDPTGELVGGAGDDNGEGAVADSRAGPGASTSAAGEGDVSGAGPGADAGAFPKSSVGRSKPSTVKMQSGVESRTVEEILDVSTPVSRLTESPAVVTLRSYFPAPLVAKVEIELFVVFNVPMGV